MTHRSITTALHTDFEKETALHVQSMHRIKLSALIYVFRKVFNIVQRDSCALVSAGLCF